MFHDGPVAINARATVRAQTGGVERVATELARRLPVLRPDRYQVFAPPSRLAHRAGHPWEQLALPALAAASRCELILSPANLAPLVSQRNVIVIHDTAVFRIPESFSSLYGAYHRALVARLAGRAALVLTVSEFSRAELVELLRLPDERLRVITPGVQERFHTAVADPAISARYAIREPYVLSLGTVSARKNLDALTPVARALASRGVELVLAGSDRGYLSGRAPLGVRRIGYVADDDLPALYAGARAFVMPSRYEGFGLPCLEAMACGTPVIASARAALPQTVGDAGILAEPNALTDAVENVLDDAALRERLVQAGRERAAQLTWERTVRQVDAGIDELLLGSPPGRET